MTFSQKIYSLFSCQVRKYGTYKLKIKKKLFRGRKFTIAGQPTEKKNVFMCAISYYEPQKWTKKSTRSTLHIIHFELVNFVAITHRPIFIIATERTPESTTESASTNYQRFKKKSHSLVFHITRDKFIVHSDKFVWSWLLAVVVQLFNITLIDLHV